MGKNNHPTELSYHGGVKENGYPYPLNLVIRFSVTITTTKVSFLIKCKVFLSLCKKYFTFVEI